MQAIVNTEFYKDKLSLIRLILLLQVIIIGALIAFIVLKAITKPDKIYFPTSDLGQLITPMPLSEASMTNGALLNWVSNAVMAAYSFNYKNGSRQWRKLKPYFKDSAFREYIKILTSDDYMKQVPNNKLIVSATALESPELLKELVVKNRKVWSVKVPIRVNYQNKLTLLRQIVNIHVVVMRVPETENPIGVQIIKFASDVVSQL